MSAAAHQQAVWRRERLTAAGFPLPLAIQLAKDVRYDVHVLIELAESGCPPALAVRILGPIDAGTAA